MADAVKRKPKRIVISDDEVDDVPEPAKQIKLEAAPSLKSIEAVDLSLEKKAVEKKSATRYRLILTENWERMLSAGQLRMKNGTILTMGVRENAPVNPFASNSALKSSWEFCISIRKDDQLIAFDPSRAPIATVSDFSESAPRWSKFMIKAKNKSMGVIIARWILLVVNVQCPKATMMEYDIRDEKDCDGSATPKFWLKEFKLNGLFSSVDSEYFIKSIERAEQEFEGHLLAASMTWQR